MSELPMRGHFRYLRFKTFPMTLRTPQCKVFCLFLSSSEHSGVPEDSNSQLFQVLGFTPTLGQSKGATQSITNLEAAHRYLRSLEGTPTLRAQVLQWVFAEFGDSYTLLDVYNISKKLELAHAHYEANTMRPPSRSRPQPPPAAPTRLSHSSSRTKTLHLATPILPSCNYCGNPAHKASECNIPSEDLFCDYCGKEGHQKSVCFAKFPKRKQLRLQRQNLPASSVIPQPKAKAPQPST